MTSFKLCFKGYALMNKLKRASCKMELAKSELEAMAASYPGGMYDYVSLYICICIIYLNYYIPCYLFSEMRV